MSRQQQTGGFKNQINSNIFNKLGDEEVILPPGMELISTTIYGQLSITIDNLLYLNSPQYPSDEVRIRAKFWGEKGPGKIFRARNSNIELCDMYPCSRSYQVCCQMEQFYKYLEDMSKNNKLRMTVTDNVNKSIGYFTVDFLPYLKPSLGFSDYSPFDDIEFIFPIMSVKKDQQKIGEIKVLIESSFDPNKSQFIREYSEGNTLNSDSRIRQTIQDTNDKDQNYQQNNQNFQNSDREIFDNYQSEQNNKVVNSFDDRIPNSLIEKKQQLDYQANKFLENVPKKVNLGLELMEEIYNDNEEDEEYQDNYQQQLQKQNNTNIFGKNNYGIQQQQQQQEKYQYIDQNQPVRDQTFPNINNIGQNSNYSSISNNNNNKIMSMFNSQENQQGNQQIIQQQKTTFQNQDFFVEQDNINQKLDKILALGENIFQMKQEQSQMQQNQFETVKRRNDSSPIKQQNYLSINSNKKEQNQSQQISTAQFERGIDQSSDISINQSNILKDEIEKQKQFIREQTVKGDSQINPGSMLSRLSFKKKEDDNKRRQQSKSAQMVEYNLPKVNDVNKNFNELDQQAHTQAEDEQKIIPQTQAPINLEEIKQSESLELNILEFNCLHEHLLTKFKQRNIFIACTIPSIFKSSAEVQEGLSLEDSYKQFNFNKNFQMMQFKHNFQMKNRTFCREVNGEEFIFKQKFTLSIEINDDNYLRINSASIQFTLNSFILPQKEVQDQKRIMMQIASGEFKMNKLFEQKSLGGNFYINMWTTLPIDLQKSDNQNETAIMMKIPKQELQMNKQQNTNLLGQIKVSLNIKLKGKFNRGAGAYLNKTGVQSIGGSQYEQGLSYSQQIPSTLFNNFQILLKFGKLKVLNLQQYTSFNFFARYKIYGTMEQVSSDIQWDNLEPDLHHRLTMPCSLENVQKMLKIPFILEVWNKSEKGEDQIVGIMKINMSSIPKTILLPDFSGINPNFLQMQQSQLLIVCNENVSVIDLVENKDKGLLFVTIAFGSPLQISKFDTNIQQSQQDYYHSIHQRSQHNSSFYTNNSMKPPLTGQRNLNLLVDQHNQNVQSNRQLIQNSQGAAQTINVSNLYERSKQFSSAQKNQSSQLTSTQQINFKSEDKRQIGQLDNDYEEEDIRQHSLTIKPVAQIMVKPLQNQEDDYELEGSANSNLIEKFIDIMQLLNQNMSRIQQKLKKFILSFQAKELIQNKEFIEFLQSLEIGIKLGDIIPLIRLFDSQKEGSFKFEYFSKSFNSFQRYECQIRQKYQTVLSKLLEVIEASNMKPGDIDKELIRQSEFGLMRKEKFVNILKKLNLIGDNIYELVETICTLLDVKNDGLLFVSNLNDYLQSIDVYGEIKKIVLNYQWLFEMFQQDVSALLINKRASNPIQEAKQLEKEQLIYQKDKIFPNDLMKFFEEDNSYWEILLLIAIIKGKNEIYSINELSISGEQLKIFLSALKFQAQSSRQQNSNQLEQSGTQKTQMKSQDYSSNKKARHIEINNLSQIDAVSNISQSGVQSMKKSAAQKKQEQDELELITDLLNDQVTSNNTNNLFSQNKSQSKLKQKNNIRNEFEDDDFQEIPTSDNHRNNQIKKKQVREEFDDDSFERQEKLLQELEEKSQLKSQEDIVNNKNQTREEQPQQKSISQTLQKKKFKVVHKFTVNIHKIIAANLGKELDMENALLFYQFGDQERVQIGSFDYFYGQSRYDVNYQGEKTYKLNNEEDLENVLIQENIGIKIDFEVTKSKQNVASSQISYSRNNNLPLSSSDKIKAVANLSSFVLLDIISSSQKDAGSLGNNNEAQPYVVEQSINLINIETNQSIGKVLLSIQYKSKNEVVELERINKHSSSQSKLRKENREEVEEEECLLEKETKVKKLLPKNGFLNITISAACSLKQHEIEWKNYKIILFCDLFHENSYLSTIFKGLNSTASYNMTEEVLTVQENYQINLSQEIINYFQDNTCLIQLRIFPLDDIMRRSNPIILGELFLNLQYLLINQEINEESLVIKRSDINCEGENEFKNQNQNVLPISSSRESIGICSVQITYTKEKQFIQQPSSSILQQQKEITNKSQINQPTQKDVVKNNYHQVFILFDEILSLIEYDNSLITDQMCYFRASVNGKIIEGKDTFKMNFIEMKLQELQGNTYLQFLVETEELQFINPLNVDILIRDMNKQQSEETILGHISIDFEILRKEFFQNLLENNSMKCIKSSAFTLIRRNKINAIPRQSETESTIEDSIMSIRINLRLLLIKYETKGDYEACQQFLQLVVLSNLSKNINATGSTDILEQLRISLRYSRQDFDSILNYLTFDKQTLFALLCLSENQLETNNQKCALLQNECQQLLEDIQIYDKKENGIVDLEDLKRVLRKYNPSLREKIQPQVNKLDRNFAKIMTENIGLNIQKCDYLQFLKENGILNTIQESQNSQVNKYQLKLKIEKATNIGILFNGVAPNSYIKCVQFDITTACLLRDLNPQFDHPFEIDLQPNQFKNNHLIKFILYHRGYNSDFRDNMYKSIELGTATLDLSKLFFTKTKELSKQEQFKLKIEGAHYSSRIQNESYLLINVQLNNKNQQQNQNEQSQRYTYHNQPERNQYFEGKKFEQEQEQKDYLLDNQEDDENLIYNGKIHFQNFKYQIYYNQNKEEAFNNFQQTLMELRQQEQEEEQLGDRYTNQKLDYDQQISQNQSAQQEDDYTQTLRKNKQLGTQQIQTKEQKIFEKKYEHKIDENSHNNDYSDIMLEKAMNDIDDLKREFDSDLKQQQAQDYNFSKKYEDKASYYQEENQDYLRNIKQKDQPKPDQYEEKQIQKRDIYGSEDELDDLRKTLQELNQESEFGQVGDKQQGQDKMREDSYNYNKQYTNSLNQVQQQYQRDSTQQTSYITQKNNTDHQKPTQSKDEGKSQHYSSYLNYLDKNSSLLKQQYPQNIVIQNKDGNYDEYEEDFKYKIDNNNNNSKNENQAQFNKYQPTISYQQKEQEEKYQSNNFSNKFQEQSEIYENLKQTREDLRNNLQVEKYETFKPTEYQSNYSSSGKPPIKKSDSQNSLKKLEKKILPQAMKDSTEIDRISNIMKQDFSKQKKYFDYTSDSDDD